MPNILLSSDHFQEIAATMKAAALPISAIPPEYRPRRTDTKLQILGWSSPSMGWQIYYWDADDRKKEPRPYWFCPSMGYELPRMNPPIYALPLPGSPA